MEHVITSSSANAASTGEIMSTKSVLCKYEPEHFHEYPKDWFFGGPQNSDPRADPRWKPASYTYLDGSLHEVWSTGTPLCDDQALDECSKHAELRVVYVQVKRPEAPIEILPWSYDSKTDTLTPL
jgi:hypothetical protein